MEFEKYKEDLFKVIIKQEYEKELSVLIEALNKDGKSKQEIYELFLKFHHEIQIDSRTKNNERIYDKLSDFMDGFTNWQKKYKILPDEPDL